MKEKRDKDEGLSFVDVDYIQDLFTEDALKGEEAPNENKITDETEHSVEPKVETPKSEDLEENNLTEIGVEEKGNEFIVDNPDLSVSEVVSGLIENNIWEDVGLKYEGVEYNSIADLIKEKKPNKELFDQLVEVQKNLQKEKLENSYIKVDDPESVRAKVAKAVLEGADYQEVVEETNQMEAIQNFDLTKRENAQSMIAYYYKEFKNADLDDEVFRTALMSKLEKLEKEGDLISESEKYRDIILQNFYSDIQAKLDQEKEAEKERARLRREKVKEFKNNLKSRDFKDSFISKAKELRFNEDGGDPEYVSLIKEKIESDPNFEVDFIHFLLDREDFLKTKKEGTKLETSRRMIELTGKKPKGSGKPSDEPVIEGDLPAGLQTVFSIDE